MPVLDPRLLDAIAAPLIVIDRGGRVVTWNAAHAELVGYPAEEVAGRDTRDLVRPPGGLALAAAIEQLFGGERRATVELEWNTRTGAIARQVLEAELGPSDLVVATATRCATAGEHETVRRLFDLAPLGILILGADGTTTFNPRAEEILGIPLAPERGNDQYASLMHHSDGTPVAREALPSSRALARGETTAAAELVVHRPDGTVRSVLVSAGPVFGSGHDVVRAVVIFQDITERKRAEATLRGSHDRLEAIVSLAADAIITIDEDQRIVLFNEGAERIFEHRAADVVGKPLDTLIPERYREHHRELVAEFARGRGQAGRMHGERPTISGLRKSGEEFPAEAGISRVQMEGATLMTVVLRDLTHRLRDENRYRFLAHAGAVLASSLDYQETLTVVARLAVPILADCCVVDLLDTEGEPRAPRRLKVVHVDPTKAALAAGLEAVESPDPRRHPIWRLVEQGRSVLLREVPDATLEEMAQGSEHLRLLRELAPVSLLAVPLATRGRVLGALTFVSVRADHVYGGDELRLAEDLARRAAMAIDNAQLHQKTLQAVRARDEVLGVVAHDLRNPLNAMMLTAQLLATKLGTERPDAQELATRIVRAGQSANRLIQDLLDVASLEAGRLAIERSSVACVDLISEVMEILRPLAEQASLEIMSEVEPGLPPIAGDRHRLLQVLSNLTGNAIKFTPSGGRVALSAAREGASVRFSVTDTGRGIAPEHLPHLFDRFWQARPTDRQGAGLGLAITKGIVEAHGGALRVESTVGRGSAFSFTVPISQNS